MNSKQNIEFRAVLDSWLSTLPEETAKAYGRMLRALAARGRSPLVIGREEITEYVHSETSTKMKQRAVSAVHSFYGYALDREKIKSDPSRRVSLRRLEFISNVDLLKQLRLSKTLTWGGALSSLEKTCAQSRDRKELMKRALIRVRKCRSTAALLIALREAIAEK